MKHLLLTLLLVACSREHEHKAVSEGNANERISELRVAFEQKTAEYLASADAETGWPSTTDCDGLLFASLAAASGVDVRLDLAESSPGEWQRRPYKPCWTEAEGDIGSKSTISQDMLTGVLWAAWARRDLALLQRLAGYGEANNWFMGKPASMASRVLLRTNTVGLLGRQIYALSGGSDDRSYRSLFEYYSPVGSDYERHIQALGIALQGSVNETLRRNSLDASVEPRGGESFSLLDLNDQMMTRIRELSVAEPTNPLFHAVLGTYTGDFSRAIELLLDPNTPVPSYVRGDRADNFWRAEWLFTARLVLERYPQ